MLADGPSANRPTKSLWTAAAGRQRLSRNPKFQPQQEHRYAFGQSTFASPSSLSVRLHVPLRTTAAPSASGPLSALLVLDGHMTGSEHKWRQPMGSRNRFTLSRSMRRRALSLVASVLLPSATAFAAPPATPAVSVQPLTPSTQPIRGVIPNVWTWIPIPGAYCDDGSPTGIGVNLPPTSSNNLLIAFEGGGACWDYPWYGVEPSGATAVQMRLPWLASETGVGFRRRYPCRRLAHHVGTPRKRHHGCARRGADAPPDAARQAHQPVEQHGQSTFRLASGPETRCGVFAGCARSRRTRRASSRSQCCRAGAGIAIDA
jgi:hypothetical protein